MNHPAPKNIPGMPAPGAPGTTVTRQIKPSTKNKYDAIYENYMAQYMQWTRIAEDAQFPWRDFAMWLIAAVDSRDISPSYMGTIRAAILYKMNEMDANEDAKTAARIVDLWEPTGSSQVTEEPKRRSRTSKRMIPKKDWSTLINHFNMNPGKWGVRAQSMLSASIACGARPIEWIYAHLVGENTIRLYNAKIKNINAWNAAQPGRFHEGQHSMQQARQEVERTMEDRIRSSGLNPATDTDLINEIRQSAADFESRVFRDVTFSPEFNLPVNLMIRYIESFFQEKFGPDWRDSVPSDTLEKVYADEFCTKVRVSLWRACRSRFGDEKLYSIADARSTFAANRKAQFGIERAAADLGHSSTSKTRNNYAPARKAWR